MEWSVSLLPIPIVDSPVHLELKLLHYQFCEAFALCSSRYGQLDSYSTLSGKHILSASFKGNRKHPAIYYYCQLLTLPLEEWYATKSPQLMSLPLFDCIAPYTLTIVCVVSGSQIHKIPFVNISLMFVCSPFIQVKFISCSEHVAFLSCVLKVILHNKVCVTGWPWLGLHSTQKITFLSVPITTISWPTSSCTYWQEFPKINLLISLFFTRDCRPGPHLMYANTWLCVQVYS